MSYFRTLSILVQFVSVVCCGLILLPMCLQGAPAPTPILLKKWTQQSGQGTYSLEQELQFQGPQQSLAVRESWLIDSTESMKLTVTGLRDLKASLRRVVLYQNGQKILKLQGESTQQALAYPKEFYERFFWMRKADTLSAELLRRSILVPQSLITPLPRNSKDRELKSDPRVRPARVGGIITLQLGEVSSTGQPLPGIWLDQETLYPKKIRLLGESGSSSELTIESTGAFPKGLTFPAQRVLKWANSSVTMTTLGVSWKGEKSRNLNLTPQDLSTSFESIQDEELRKLISEFYSRFR